MIALKYAKTLAPHDLGAYRAQKGFEALKKALSLSQEDIVAEVEKSGLRGRGGAGFPTGLKWKFTMKASGSEKFAIANADEGEPGTFKDREIMEKSPFVFLEGLIIGALAIGAETAYIYLRKEYEVSSQSLVKAIKILEENNLAGKNILGSGKNVEVLMAYGAGSYLCGDETTLLESMEGKRGNPRFKPPFPANHGFRNLPSLINNVETLSHIPDIILKGSDWYSALGAEGSPGTKVYCLSGPVAKPGNYELEMGVSLRELIYDHAGGIKAGKKLKGALLGGAAGTFVSADHLDVKMDFESLKKIGATLGSGAVIVLDEDTSVPKLLHNILNFFKHESCGKCVPCRIGCQRLLDMSDELPGANGNKEQLITAMMAESKLMSQTSLCGLGQSPVLPVTSAFKYFKNEF